MLLALRWFARRLAVPWRGQEGPTTVRHAKAKSPRIPLTAHRAETIQDLPNVVSFSRVRLGWASHNEDSTSSFRAFLCRTGGNASGPCCFLGNLIGLRGGYG